MDKSVDEMVKELKEEQREQSKLLEEIECTGVPADEQQRELEQQILLAEEMRQSSDKVNIYIDGCKVGEVGMDEIFYYDHWDRDMTLNKD